MFCWMNILTNLFALRTGASLIRLLTSHILCDISRANINVDLSKYQKKIDQILSLLAEKDKALEINTSGLRQKLKRTLPDESIVMRYKELGGKLITIGSDAHYAKHLGLGIGKAMDMAKRCGFDSVALFQSRNPMEIPIE